MVVQSPQPLPEVIVLLRLAKDINGEVRVIFSKYEIEHLIEPFKFWMALKFIRQRPMLDVIRSFIRSRWGLGLQTVVSSMHKPCIVFIRLSNEAYFLEAQSREATDIDGVPYRGFHWHPNFNEDREPSLVLVWVVLLGLQSNFYHESFLKNSIAPIERFLRRDIPQSMPRRLMEIRCVWKWMRLRNLYMGSGLESLISQLVCMWRLSMRLLRYIVADVISKDIKLKPVIREMGEKRMCKGKRMKGRSRLKARLRRHWRIMATEMWKIIQRG